MEKENLLVDLSKAFAVNSIRVYEIMKANGRALAILNQFLRSATAIGANVHEGNYAASKADFVNKFQIALKECYETEYWLDIFRASGILEDTTYQELYDACHKLRRLLTSSIRTAKNNM